MARTSRPVVAPFFGVLGILMVLAGGVGIALGVTGGFDTSKTDGIGGGLGVMVGGLGLLFVGWHAARLGTNAVADAVRATGVVTTVRDTRVEIDGARGIFAITVDVDRPDLPAYQTEFKVPLARHLWGAIVPGMTLPLVTERNDPKAVALDPTGGAVSEPALADLVGETLDAAAIAATGVPTTAVLGDVEPTGLRADAVVDGLPAAKADDPLVKVTMTFSDAGGESHTTSHLVRVPDGKAGYLASGAKVPAAYPVGDPDSAVINFAALTD